MAAELLGAPLEAALLDRLAEASQGNPLYVEEMLRMLADEGALERRDGSWAAAGELDEIETPPSIETLISARLERLGARERAVAEAASVVGQVFWATAVAELAERQAVAPELETLLKEEIVVDDAERFRGQAGYRFAHILVRDAAYERLLKETRAIYHERFARWLERMAAARLPEYEEIVGYHLERAYRYREELGPPDEHARALAARAVTRVGAAGGRAYEREDIAGAIALLDQALSLPSTDAPHRAELMVDLGMALIDAGELERADGMLTQAAEGAAASGGRNLELRALLERAFGRSLTDPEDSQAQRASVTKEAIRAFEASGDELGLARALLLSATEDVGAMRYRDAEAKLRPALEYATRAGARRHRNEIVYWISAALYFGPTPTGDAVRRLEDLGMEELGAPGRGVECVPWLGPLYAMRGDFKRARLVYERAQRVNEELGHELNAAAHCQAVGEVELLAGEPAQAEAALRRGYEKLAAMGERGYLATVAHQLADALLAQSRWEDAERFSAEAEELAAPSDLHAQTGWRRTRACVLARRGDVREAQRLGHEAVALARRSDSLDMEAASFVALGEVLELSGERDRSAAGGPPGPCALRGQGEPGLGEAGARATKQARCLTRRGLHRDR